MIASFHVQQCGQPWGTLQHAARCSTRTPLSSAPASVQPLSERISRCVGTRPPLGAITSGGVYPTTLYLTNSQQPGRASQDLLHLQSAPNGIGASRRASSFHRQPALSPTVQQASASAESTEPPAAGAAAAATVSQEDPVAADGGISPPFAAAAASGVPHREVRFIEMRLSTGHLSASMRCHWFSCSINLDSDRCSQRPPFCGSKEAV